MMKMMLSHFKLGCTAGVVALALCALSAQAALNDNDDEMLISNNNARELRGETTIDLMNELNLMSMRGRMTSVIVIASSRRGHGQMEILANERTVSSSLLTSDLQAIQIRLDNDFAPAPSPFPVPPLPFPGAGVRRLEIRTHGNVTIAMMGVTIEDGFNTPGDVMNDHQAERFIRDVCRGQNDGVRLQNLREELADLRGRRLTHRQALPILQCLSPDAARIEALRRIRPQMVVEYALVQQTIDLFISEQARREARRTLRDRD